MLPRRFRSTNSPFHYGLQQLLRSKLPSKNYIRRDSTPGGIKQMIRAFPKLNDRSIITSEFQLRRKDWARSAFIALPRAIAAQGSLQLEFEQKRRGAMYI